MGIIYSAYVLKDYNENNLLPENLKLIAELELDDVLNEGEKIVFEGSVNGRRADTTTYFYIVSINNIVRPRTIILKHMGSANIH